MVLGGFVLFEGKSPLKECLNFDGRSRQWNRGKWGYFIGLCKNQLGNNSSWIAPRLITHINELHCSHEAFTYIAYLFGWDTYLHSSSLSKQKFFCRSFEISYHRMIRNNRWFWDSVCSFFPKNLRNLLVESRIDPKIPVIGNQPKRYANASYEQRSSLIRVTNLETIHEEVLPTVSSLLTRRGYFIGQTDHRSWGNFSMVTCFQITQHKWQNHRNQPKNPCKPADFR